MTSLTRPMIAVVRWYQKTREARPSPCRFEPSCSTYTIEALQDRGAIVGLALSVRRLSRCRPLGGRGWDPVPPKKARS